MMTQIEQALGRLDKMAPDRRDALFEVLSRYVRGEIGLDLAYYELLDLELVPMPSRCGLKAKLPAGDEEKFRERIKERLANQS
ncbi:MAG: hypothetical protein JW986_05655 [Methanotrichaceae archaeon]|nr:hypothetical protein [Methanotrichaceae archaeon]